MKPPRMIDDAASAVFVACALLLVSAGAVDAGEQVSYFEEAKLAADDGEVFGRWSALRQEEG